MIEVLIPSLENLAGVYITVQHVYEMNTGKSYFRYDLMRFGKPLLSFTSSEFLSKDYVKNRLIWEYNKIACEMLEIYNSPVWESIKAYKDTLKAIDNL